jgi:hypothetical protein
MVSLLVASRVSVDNADQSEIRTPPPTLSGPEACAELIEKVEPIMAQNVCRLSCCGPREIRGQCEESSSRGSTRVGQVLAQASFEGHEKYGQLYLHASKVGQHALAERYRALDNAL